MLLTQLWEKGVIPTSPTQNVQMMKAEPRTEDPNINMMLRSGTSIGEDKGKKTKAYTWVRKALVKQPEFDLTQASETFLEAKEKFMEASPSSSKGQPDLQHDNSLITTFLETCMKLLRDANAVKGLWEFIARCVRADEPHMIRKLGKHVLHTEWEMRLTA